jgi:hypothetical protein
MRKKIIIMAACLLVSVLASACSPTLQTVEVTRVVPQTVVVTQLVTQIVRVNITTTPIPADTPVPGTPTPLPTDTPGSDILTPLPTQVLDMSKQQDGSIVIVQYCTLLDMHLYDQAWQLFSTEYQTPARKKNFFEGTQYFYKVIKVLKVVPFNEWLIQNGSPSSKDNINKYHVELYGEGYGAFSGANENGRYGITIQVTLENNEWKISGFPGS